MSEVCSCYNPEVYSTGNNEKYCKRCGFWWMPKYGSFDPETPMANLREKQRMLRESQKATKEAQYRSIFKRGRNEACWCGSGKKFKKCCINKV